MGNTTGETAVCTDIETWTLLESIAREGARKMLQQDVGREQQHLAWCLNWLRKLRKPGRDCMGIR